MHYRLKMNTACNSVISPKILIVHNLMSTLNDVFVYKLFKIITFR